MKAGIQAIIQKIKTDEEEHSNERYMQIKNDIDIEIANENNSYLEELAKRRDMLKNNNEHEYSRLLERLHGRLNREILMYQHNLIDEIFDMAVIKLREASKEEFTDMFKSAIKGLKGNFNLYLGELSAGKLDNQEIDNAVKENDGINIVLNTETIFKKSGFVLSDDRVEYNCLFEDLIEDKKTEQAALILKEVFGDSEIRFNI